MSSAQRFWQPDYPFRPDRVPIFYGWIILVAMTIGVVMSIPGQTMGVSVFTNIFIEALDLSRVQISFSYLLGTAASGFLLPYGGVLLDRFGVRRIVVFTAVFFGLVIVGMGQCDRVAAFLSQFFPSGHSFAVAFCVITAGFFGLRFLGQGMLTITSRAMLGRWFDRRRGFTLALSGALISLAFSAAPKLLNLLIERLGWRETYSALGGALIFGMTAIGWLLFRDTPEECGLEMDGGRVPAKGDPVNQDFTLHREMTRSEAMRTYSFWAFNLGTALQALVITAYTFHIVSIGEDAGLSKDLILSLFFPMAGVGLMLSFVCGWIARPHPHKIRPRAAQCWAGCRNSWHASAAFITRANVDHSWFGRGRRCFPDCAWRCVATLLR